MSLYFSNRTGLIQFSEFISVMSEAMSHTTQWGTLKTEIKGYVGIDTIQEQIRKKALKKGFEFNIMVVGKCLMTKWNISLIL